MTTAGGFVVADAMGVAEAAMRQIAPARMVTNFFMGGPSWA
jgi:hypothetical protein